jgi:hypothetical protein
LFENVVDLREEIAARQAAFAEAPRFPGYFCDPDISRLERLPYLARQPMDKLGTELDWSLADWVTLRENPAADPVARLEDSNGETRAP